MVDTSGHKHRGCIVRKQNALRHEENQHCMSNIFFFKRKGYFGDFSSCFSYEHDTKSCKAKYLGGNPLDRVQYIPFDPSQHVHFCQLHKCRAGDPYIKTKMGRAGQSFPLVCPTFGTGWYRPRSLSAWSVEQVVKPRERGLQEP